MPNVLPLWSHCSSSQKALAVCTEVQSGPQQRAGFQDARAIGNFHGAAPGELQHERAGRMGSQAEGRGSPDNAQSAMALPGDGKALPRREGCACPLVARGAWFNQSREKAPTRSVSRICVSKCGAEELPAPRPLGCASNPCPGQQPGHGGCCLGGCHRGEPMGGPCGNGWGPCTPSTFSPTWSKRYHCTAPGSSFMKRSRKRPTANGASSMRGFLRHKKKVRCGVTAGEAWYERQRFYRAHIEKEPGFACLGTEAEAEVAVRHSRSIRWFAIMQEKFRPSDISVAPAALAQKCRGPGRCRGAWFRHDRRGPHAGAVLR